MLQPIAIDTETPLMQPGQAAPPLVVLSYTTDRIVGREQLLHGRFDRAAVHQTVGEVLTNRNVLYIGGNAPYDLAVFVREFPDLWAPVFDAFEQNRVYDVLQAQKLIDIANDEFFVNRGNYNVAGVARRHLGLHLEKDTWRTLYGQFMDVPLSGFVDRARQLRPHDPRPEGVLEYPKLDAHVPFAVAESQMTHSHQLLDDVYRQTRAAWWMHLMVCHGFRTDQVAVKDLRRRVEKERDELCFVLRAHGLLRGDGSRDTGKAQERMVEVCRARGVDVKMTDGGESGNPEVCLDEDACLQSKDAVLKAYARFSSLNTIYTKDIPALERPLIQSNFEVLVETGRTSCSGGAERKGKKRALAEFQLQNVRKEPGVRECFVPREGNFLLSVDYGQMELHAWSQVCLSILGYSALAEALNKGTDVHVLFGCSRVHGHDYEVAVANKKKAPYKDGRQMAKAANFGFPGGLGAAAFMEYSRTQWDVILDRDQAKHLKSEWLQMWPEAPAYFDFITRLIGRGGFGTVAHLGSNRLRGGVHFTNACNSFFQGLAADTAKHAGFLISRACYVDRSSVLYGSRIVNFVHDEFILEVPAHIAHECAMEVVRLMEEAGKIWMPQVPPRAEPALMRRWMKAAEPAWENKRLVPWEPQEKAAA